VAVNPRLSADIRVNPRSKIVPTPFATTGLEQFRNCRGSAQMRRMTADQLPKGFARFRAFLRVCFNCSESVSPNELGTCWNYKRAKTRENSQIKRPALRQDTGCEGKPALSLNWLEKVRRRDLSGAHSKKSCECCCYSVPFRRVRGFRGNAVQAADVSQPLLRPCPFANRSTRSTVRNRASDVGLVPTTRIAVLDRCDDDAKPRTLATSRRS